MTVVDKLAEDDLIGNGSQAFSLPTIPGKHSDLKSIASTTVRNLYIVHGYDSVKIPLLNLNNVIIKL